MQRKRRSLGKKIGCKTIGIESIRCILRKIIIKILERQVYGVIISKLTLLQIRFSELIGTTLFLLKGRINADDYQMNQLLIKLSADEVKIKVWQENYPKQETSMVYKEMHRAK